MHMQSPQTSLWHADPASAFPLALWVLCHWEKPTHCSCCGIFSSGVSSFFFFCFLPFLPTKNTPKNPAHLFPVPPPILWNQVSCRRVQPEGAQMSPGPSMTRAGPWAQPDAQQPSNTLGHWQGPGGFFCPTGHPTLGFA